MKKEDIEKAAEKYAEENSWYPGETSYESDIIAIEESFADAFKAGVKWRINSVWHDIKEMPENNRMILIIMQHDIPTVLGPDNTFFKEEVKDRQIHRWAYVDDLKPNMEE
jgi:ethanolamine utilization protein EutA (predicted chaperonin)|nr:MAG TPA: hypothetical protein [Caudoviricetes sp.]